MYNQHSTTPKRGLSADNLVSVIIPLYNHGAFIRGCLASVAAQTHKNLEVIVVDDASTDLSADEAAAALSDYDNLFSASRLVREYSNQGLALTRNAGIAASSGRYVFLLDADNELYPRAIERLLEAIVVSNAQAAYCQLEHFGEELGLGVADVWNPDRFAKDNYVDAMALIEKAALETVGGYSVMYAPGWEDYDLWCKFIEQEYFGVYVPEILCRYRVTSGSMLRTHTKANAGILRSQLIQRHSWLRARSQRA
jgi:glycosyltransferase involved in cell wall biosynthesis